MPGSPTAPGRPGTRTDAPVRVAFRQRNSVGTRDELAFAARWLACALPYRRFAATLAGADARLGADVDRYSFIVVDLHHLLLAGRPAHSVSSHVLILTLHMSLSVRSDKRLICLGRNFRLRPPRRLGTGTESAKTSRGEETAQDPRAKPLIQLWFQAAAYRTGSGTGRAKSSLMIFTKIG